MTTEPQESAATQRGVIPVDSFANRLMLARAHGNLWWPEDVEEWIAKNRPHLDDNPDEE